MITISCVFIICRFMVRMNTVQYTLQYINKAVLRACALYALCYTFTFLPLQFNSELLLMLLLYNTKQPITVQ